MPVAELLPPIPSPPHDPRSIRLNALAGWRTTEQSAIDVTAGDALTLAIPPSAARSFDEASGSLGGLALPHRLAIAGNVLLLWDPAGKLKRLDPCACAFREIPCVSFNAAAMSVCGNNLYIADPAARKVFVLTLETFALRDDWSPPKGAVPNPWRPVSIALDSRRRFYVADRDNAAVHRFHPSGRWEGSFSANGAPVRIAVDRHDRLLVVRESQPGAILLDRDGKLLATLAAPQEAAPHFDAPIVTERDGNFDASPFCQGEAARWFTPAGVPLERTSPPPPVYADSGSWIAGPLDSRVAGCVWHRVILDAHVPPGTSIEVSTLTADAVLPAGHLTLAEVQWQRHPARLTRLAKGQWDCLVPSPPGRYLWLRLELAGNHTSTPSTCEINVEFPRISLRRFLPGFFGEQPLAADFTDRFLAVFDTTLRSIEQHLDRQALLFDPRSAPAGIDPQSGVDFLSWLASWLGIALDREWPEARRREWLLRAGELFCLRGTREGLLRELLLLFGMESRTAACPADCRPCGSCRRMPECVPCPPRPPFQAPPLILEHFQIRRWLFLGCGRIGEQSELWGREIVNRSQLNENAQVGATKLVTSQDPYRDPFHVQAHRFSVFVPASWAESPAARRSLRNLLEMEKPAHTQAQVEYVEPRFRIGVQASIGLNSVVGRYPLGYRLGEALGGESLFPPAARRAARIGITTELN